MMTSLSNIELKNPDGKRLLKKFSVPRNPSKKDPRTRIRPTDDPVDGPALYAYNMQDVRAEFDISIRVPDLPPAELEIWQVDQIINQRGIAVDMVAVENCIAIVEQAHARYNAELYALTNGHVAEASEVAKLVQWIATQGVYIGDLQEETVEEWVKKPGLPPAVKRALEIRAMLGSASVKKLFAFRAQSWQGRLYDLYAYFGGRTGRWSAYGPQPQNMPKGDFHTIEEVEAALAVIATRSLEAVELCYGDALSCISSVLRGLLIAAPGHDLVCSDFSAIEGVVTAALAGEEWRLEVFRTHGMIYETSAAKITGIPFEEFVRHKRETGKHHPQRNLIGKFAELASGFGGWVGAWVNFGADEYLTEQQMKAGVLAWRRASPMIVELWGGQSRGEWEGRRPELYGLEGAAIMAVKHPGRAYTYRGITYQTSGDVLYCQVPDGGLLTYHSPRLEPSRRPYAAAWELSLSYEGWNSNPQQGPIGWVRMSLYGGKQTENVVQKVARTWQASALVRLERAGYRPVLHSHDEVAGEVPLGWGSVEEFERIASVPPHPFYAGWPIRMKGGWRGPRYGKFE